ncbi:MAG: hypothetical protein DAHOPDDO_00061 [Ignavibacteriaceae bacterium]|nr:hypothetical protein [Ignavibacteriaceae bacterium]
MKKWADYLISGVRYDSNSQHKVISYLRVHIDNGDTVAECRTWDKDEVLKAFSNGYKFLTIIKDNYGRWLKGKEITISRQNDSFIITDSTNTTNDSLQNILEF